MLLFCHSVRFGFSISVPLQLKTIHITHAMLGVFLVLFFLPIYLFHILFSDFHRTESSHKFHLVFLYFSAPTPHTPNTQKHASSFQMFVDLFIWLVSSGIRYLYRFSTVFFHIFIFMFPMLLCGGCALSFWHKIPFENQVSIQSLLTHEIQYISQRNTKENKNKNKKAKRK